MAEAAGPTRGMIVVGDKTTAGGVVIEGTARSTIKSKAVALQGHKINCPACGSEGYIELVPPFAGAPVDGVEIALSDDLCICGCNPPPRLISSNIGFATHGFSAKELGHPAAAPWLLHAGYDPAAYGLTHDEQFQIRAKNGAPIQSVRYRIRGDSNWEVSGTTDQHGKTQRVFTSSPETLHLYVEV